MSKLIALGGVAFSGKDALADFLTEEFGVHKTFMSRPLEVAFLKLNPWININWDNWVSDSEGKNTWPKEALWKAGHISTKFMRYRDLHAIIGYTDSKQNHDVRQGLQVLGTEIGRDMCGESVWVDWNFREIRRMRDEGMDVSLTGIRYPNELEAAHAAGGLCVWVQRPGYGPVNGHSSDNSLGATDFDLIVHNDGTLADLRQKACQLFKSEAASGSWLEAA